MLQRYNFIAIKKQICLKSVEYHYPTLEDGKKEVLRITFLAQKK